MGAYFTWRRTRVDDLPTSLAMHPAKNGAEVVGYKNALKAWQQILEMRHATRSALVEMHSGGKTEIVGFGFSTFVKKSFAEAEVENPSPNMNSRILESVLNGRPVIASYEEVRSANTRGALEQVNMDTSSRKVPPLTADQVNELRILLGRAYAELYCGYRISRVFLEVVDELDFSQAQIVRAFRTIKKFEPSGPESDSWYPERALIALDANTMRDDPLSAGAAVFQRHALPQFRLTRGEQELMELALGGMDDSAAASEMNVSLPAVKHRWASIFERVAAVRPDLCPADLNGTRGIQKRQRVLAHVRKHPEELRPFDFDKQGNGA